MRIEDALVTVGIEAVWLLGILYMQMIGCGQWLK